MWYQVAEEVNGKKVFIGYYSLLNKNPINTELKVPFVEIPRNEHLIWDSTDNYVIDRLKWVTKNQYVLEEKEGDTLLHDLRLGLVNTFVPLPDNQYQYAFSYKLLKEKGEFVEIQRLQPFQEETKDLSGTEQFGFMYDNMITPLWEKMMDADSIVSQ